ncbi:GlxA family transcriptional regulator [Mycetocola sp. JXN-3]|uniref:GlxA family transcriptional regulator n=1 Tax=Mycetocola sp. JXN-3 TaxID=2116510 RepID=UPI00165D2AA2|nr:helix-turn-helix domain-containing protein [Mycetocola sp. JXN-3]
MVNPVRTIAVLAFDGVDLLDVTGPAEVFGLANREGGASPHREGGASPHYEVLIAAPDSGPIRTAAGVRLLPDCTLAELASRHIDTLIVPGAAEADEHGRIVAVCDPDIVDWVRALEPRVARIASVCVGAHILARAGILEGRRVTTHWSTAAQLAIEHPGIEVDADPIFIHEGRIWTAAGISSCLDLSLALVAEDLGNPMAIAVARQLVVYLKRPGGQSQFSVPLRDAPASRDMDELRLFISNNLESDLGVERLARQANLSDRHFARVFRQEFGQTPGQYVESLRVEAARRMLESTDDSLDAVATSTGLGSVDTLIRAFHRHLGTTPGTYRRGFRTPIR